MIDFKGCNTRRLFQILSSPMKVTALKISEEKSVYTLPSKHVSHPEVLKLKAILRALKKSGRYDEKDIKRIEEKIKRLESL